MSAIPASRNRTMNVVLWGLVVGLNLALLILIVVNGPRLPLERFATASMLIACMAIFFVGGVLFTGRAFLKWPGAATAAYLRWERGFVIAGVVATVLGLALLQGLVRDAGDSVFSLLGMVGYLVGAVVVITAETSSLGGSEGTYPQITFYVVTAFLSQAVFGVALLRTELVAGWVGWTTIIWNLGWLVLLPIFSPRDIYYPVLHHFAPLIIGIALLTQG